MDHNQIEQALATLNHLNALSPQHPYVLKLLAKTHCKLSDWESLRELLPDVKRTGALQDEKLLSLEIDTWCGLISDRGRTGDIDLITQLWEVAPRQIKDNPEVVEHYATELIKLHASGEAELGREVLEAAGFRYEEHIELGKVADLLLVEGRPDEQISDTARIVVVVQGGAVLEREKRP